MRQYLRRGRGDRLRVHTPNVVMRCCASRVLAAIFVATSRASLGSFEAFDFSQSFPSSSPSGSSFPGRHPTMPPCKGLCARTAATMPVSTSPEPPLAIPGLPVILIHTCPCGLAITVRCPFNTTHAPVNSAARLAAARRLAWMAGTGEPISRDISPGCGVITRNE